MEELGDLQTVRTCLVICSKKAVEASLCEVQFSELVNGQLSASVFWATFKTPCFRNSGP